MLWQISQVIVEFHSTPYTVASNLLGRPEARHDLGHSLRYAVASNLLGRPEARHDSGHSLIDMQWQATF